MLATHSAYLHGNLVFSIILTDLLIKLFFLLNIRFFNKLLQILNCIECSAELKGKYYKNLYPGLWLKDKLTSLARVTYFHVQLIRTAHFPAGLLAVTAVPPLCPV